MSQNAPISALQAPDCQPEIVHLHVKSHVYLDYTGAALYPETLVREHYRILQEEVFGNPHSTNPVSLASTRASSNARDALLEFLDADPADYDVVWTANASSALRLVGESFAFGPNAPFVLTADNHNTLNGMREQARVRGAPVTYLPLDDELRVLPFDLPAVQHGLFAYPAQSNFSGVRHPLDWVKRVQEQGYRVLLDAAAYLPTQALSLRETGADFLVLSFYKLCGYPTGVGALVGRRAALRELVRPAFAGGTVEFVSVLADRYKMKAGAEAFEDGTGNFLAWSAVPHGLQLLRSIGMPTIGAHVSALTERMLRGLQALRHPNGAPAIHIHGPRTIEQRGGTIAFNVAGPDQTIIDHELVVDTAAGQGICLRGGCFCNPGAAERAFRYAASELAVALDLVGQNFSLPALRRALNNKPVGAVRASLGYGSRTADVDALLVFLAEFVADVHAAQDPSRSNH